MTLKSTLHSLQTQLEESNNILKAKNQIVNQLQAQVGSLIEKHKQDTDKSSSVAGYLREEISRKTKEIDTLRDELEDLKQNSPYKIEMEKNERKIFT